MDNVFPIVNFITYLYVTYWTFSRLYSNYIIELNLNNLSEFKKNQINKNKLSPEDEIRFEKYMSFTGFYALKRAMVLIVSTYILYKLAINL